MRMTRTDINAHELPGHFEADHDYVSDFRGRSRPAIEIGDELIKITSLHTRDNASSGCPYCDGPDIALSISMTRSIVHHARCERGVTLVDTMIVIAVMAIVSSMATMQLVTVRRSLKGDGAMRVVMAQLTTAREMAITQRRNIEVQFPTDNWMQLVRHEVPSGTSVVTNIALEGSARFAVVAGVPDIPEDANGNATAVSFGTTPAIMFTPSGSLVDSAGAPLNGTIFVSVAGVPESARAVTVLGAVGRVVGYRWNGREWKRV